MATLTSPLRTFSRPTRLFLTATLFDGIMYSAWQLFFNFYILALGYDKDFLGLINAAPWLASLLLSIPLGMLTDRIGRRKSMLIGLALNVAGMAAQAAVNQPAALVVTAFLGGTGYALWATCASPFMMSNSTEENRTLLFSLNAGLVTVAGAAGSLAAGQLPGLLAGWLGVLPDSAAAYRGVLLFSVALSFCSLIPILFIEEPARETALEVRGAGLLRAFTRPLLWKLVLPNTLIGLGAGLLIPYLNLFFAEKFQLSDQLLGVLFSVSSVVTGLSIGIGPRAARRLNSKIRPTVYSQAGSLVFLLLMGFSPWAWLAAVSAVLRVAFMNMAYPLYNTFVMEQIEPGERGTVSGLYNTTNTLGWTIGPLVSGFVQQRYGFSPLFFATGALYGLAILLTQVIFSKIEAAAKARVFERG